MAPDVARPARLPLAPALVASLVLHGVALSGLTVGASFSSGGNNPAASQLQVRLAATELLRPTHRDELVPEWPRDAATEPLRADSSSPLAGASGNSGALGFVAPIQGGEPDVPEKAFALGVSGRVVVEIRLDPLGQVEEAHVVESPMAGLFDRSATLAVRSARFPPVIENGLPVRGIRRTVLIYRLS